MAQPATFQPQGVDSDTSSSGSSSGVHLWVGSTGSVYTLPLYRIAGLFSPANSVVETQPFDLPRSFFEAALEVRATQLTLNGESANVSYWPIRVRSFGRSATTISTNDDCHAQLTRHGRAKW